MNKFYVTFNEPFILSGQEYTKEGLYEIEAENYDKAHEAAYVLFGNRYSGVFSELQIDKSLFKKGVINIKK